MLEGAWVYACGGGGRGGNAIKQGPLNANATEAQGWAGPRVVTLVEPRHSGITEHVNE